MVQQLAVHSCEVGINLLPWIWSRSSLAFHQSLLYLIPGNANGLGKSTFIVYHYRRPFRDCAVRSIASILALCHLTYVICFPHVRTGRGPNLGYSSNPSPSVQL